MAAHCDFLAGVFAGMKFFAVLVLCFIWLKLTRCLLLFHKGACNMFISHPLDTVKTNMQSGNIRFIQATRILFKTEGVSCILYVTF